MVRGQLVGWYQGPGLVVCGQVRRLLELLSPCQVPWPLGVSAGLSASLPSLPRCPLSQKVLGRCCRCRLLLLQVVVWRLLLLLVLALLGVYRSKQDHLQG